MWSEQSHFAHRPHHLRALFSSHPSLSFPVPLANAQLPTFANVDPSVPKSPQNDRPLTLSIQQSTGRQATVERLHRRCHLRADYRSLQVDILNHRRQFRAFVARATTCAIPAFNTFEASYSEVQNMPAHISAFTPAIPLARGHFRPSNRGSIDSGDEHQRP